MKKSFLAIIATLFIFGFSANAAHKNAKDFSDKIVNKEGLLDKSKLKNKKYIVLYYSASWCPPCRQFTPKLVEYYNEMKEKKGSRMPFEVLLVPSDRSEKASLKYMQKMPWPGIKFGQKSSIKVVTKNSPRGIPYIVVLDKKGKVVIKDNAFAALPKLKKLLK